MYPERKLFILGMQRITALARPEKIAVCAQRACVKRKASARGFSLPMALFLLVVLGLLGAAIYRLNAAATLQTVQEVLSTRALMAAESGAQGMMLKLFPVDASAADCSAQTISFNGIDGLNDCSAVVSCTTTTLGGSNYYSVESTGRCEVGALSAQRIIEMQAKGL